MSETSFRLVRRGYEPEEVDRAVGSLRSALTHAESELETLRQTQAEHAIEVARLSEQASRAQSQAQSQAEQLHRLESERLHEVPPSYAALGERIGSMLTLAEQEAQDLVAKAQQRADELEASSEQAAKARREQADQDAEEMLSRTRAESARLVADARAEADQLMEDAQSHAATRRNEGEALYERHRAQAAAAAADFESTMAQRRQQSTDELSAQLSSHEERMRVAQADLDQARTQAHELVGQAKDRADELLRSAEHEANQMLGTAKQRAEGIRQNSERELASATARRDSITAQLANVRRMLSTLGGAAASVPEETALPGVLVNEKGPLEPVRHDLAQSDLTLGEPSASEPMLGDEDDEECDRQDQLVEEASDRAEELAEQDAEEQSTRV